MLYCSPLEYTSSPNYKYVVLEVKHTQLSSLAALTVLAVNCTENMVGVID